MSDNVLVFDCETGQATVRAFTDAELAQRRAEQAAAAAAPEPARPGTDVADAIAAAVLSAVPGADAKAIAAAALHVLDPKGGEVLDVLPPEPPLKGVIS